MDLPITFWNVKRSSLQSGEKDSEMIAIEEWDDEKFIKARNFYKHISQRSREKEEEETNRNEMENWWMNKSS